MRSRRYPTREFLLFFSFVLTLCLVAEKAPENAENSENHPMGWSYTCFGVSVLLERLFVQGNLDGAGSGGGGTNVAGADATASGPAEEPTFQPAEELPKSGSSGEKSTNAETNEKIASPRSVSVFVRSFD